MNFQTIGAKFGYEAGNSLVGDMVGLGKTPQALAISQRCLDEGEINFVIVLCSSTLKRNWYPEIKKFTLWKYCIIEGDKPKRKKVYKSIAPTCEAMIVNYEILKFDWDLIKEYIIDRGFKYHLILDELQYIKNSRAKRSQYTKALARRATRVTGLSATPLENSPTDLWSIFHAIDSTVFGNERSYTRFIERYLNEDYWGTPSGAKNTKELRTRKSPSFIRRLKDEVMDELPDRIESDFWIALSKEQREIYDDIKNRIVTEIQNQEKAEKIKMADVLPMMTYLRMATQSAALLTHKRGDSTKLDHLIDLVKDIGDIKLVVFCSFTGMIDIIGETLDKEGVGNIAIHGKNTPPNDRVGIIKHFNETPDIKVLATSDILREGVNITSANYLINFDILFNPAKMEQRVGRIDRIGNKHAKINIINFIGVKTIEEDVYSIYKDKKDIALDVIDNGKEEERMTFQKIKSLMEL